MVWLFFKIYLPCLCIALASANFDTTIECTLNESPVDSLVFDEANQIYRGFSSEDFDDNISAVPVKECWCARILRRNREYCLEKFDTCQVQGESGTVLCYSNEARTNAIRGMWPFCLFWFVTSFYLCIASQPGRRARNYVSRNALNGIDILKRQLTNTRNVTADGDHDANTETQFSARGSNSTLEEGLTVTNNTFADSIPASQVDQQAPATPRTEADNTSASIEEGSTATVPPISPADSTPRTDANSTNAASDFLISGSDYPPEFGTRSNYLRLLRELHRIHRYEPNNMLRLWHSAWTREHYRRRWQQRDQIDQELTATEGPGWNVEHTIKLSLKTKRFQDSGQCRGAAHELEENDDEDSSFSLEESRREKSCAICLAEIENGEIVGDIPCHHLFHKDCLKAWLQRCNRCPLCQQEGIASRNRPQVVTPETLVADMSSPSS